jgi:hypothetical protein
MIRFKLYLDKDSETDWLNKMSQKGYAFKKFILGFYKFEKCEPGEYIYQIDLLPNWKGDKAEFSSFMQDSGVEVIAQWYRWVYISKKASEGPFEMYTDTESKIGQYNRIKKFLLVAAGIETICLLVELNAAIHLQEVLFWGFVMFLGLVVVGILKVVWKCSWKIEQLRRDKI